MLLLESLVTAQIAQLGERKTEDLNVAGSIPALGTFCYFYFINYGARRI